MSRLGLAILTFALLSGGCSKEEPKPSAETAPAPASEKVPGPSASTPARAPASDEPTTQVTGLPTPEDYEPEAESKISAGNLESELDKLEREIDTD